MIRHPSEGVETRLFHNHIALCDSLKEVTNRLPKINLLNIYRKLRKKVNSFISVKRQDRLVQHLHFQQTSDCRNVPPENKTIDMLKDPVWAGSSFFCCSWTFMTLHYHEDGPDPITDATAERTGFMDKAPPTPQFNLLSSSEQSSSSFQ